MSYTDKEKADYWKAKALAKGKNADDYVARKRYKTYKRSQPGYVKRHPDSNYSISKRNERNARLSQKKDTGAVLRFFEPTIQTT